MLPALCLSYTCVRAIIPVKYHILHGEHDDIRRRHLIIDMLTNAWGARACTVKRSPEFRGGPWLWSNNKCVRVHSFALISTHTLITPINTTINTRFKCPVSD